MDTTNFSCIDFAKPDSIIDKKEQNEKQEQESKFNILLPNDNKINVGVNQFGFCCKKIKKEIKDFQDRQQSQQSISSIIQNKPFSLSEKILPKATLVEITALILFPVYFFFCL